MSTVNVAGREEPTPFFHDGVWRHESSLAQHAVQVYAEDRSLLDGLGEFVGTAIAAGDSAIVIATQAHRDGLSQRLRAQDLDLIRAIQQGRYVALDASETLSSFILNGVIDEARFNNIVGQIVKQAVAASQREEPHVAAFGEMVALLWQEGKQEAALQVEELWNGLGHTYPFSLRCAYPMQQFNREAHSNSFLKICDAHSAVIPGEDYTSAVSEEERCRIVAGLQQKAHALTTEIAERARVEEELRRSKAGLESLVEQRTVALRQLSARLLTLQDSERRRIARELHDGLGQFLVGLKLNVDLLRQSPDDAHLWSESEALTQQCISEVRTLSYLLHPPTMDAAGLASAAEWFVEGFSQRSGIKVTSSVSENLARLPDMIELTLFRALQETLTNVHRHSGASTADIRILRSDESVILEVKDNGAGMRPALLKHFQETGNGLGVGLTGMSERVRDMGGNLQIVSDSSGTLVRMTIPGTVLETIGA